MTFRADDRCSHCGQWHVVWIEYRPLPSVVERIEYVCPVTLKLVTANLAFHEAPGEMPADGIVAEPTN